MRIVAAHTRPRLAPIRRLFIEYARSLNIDLCFQNFEQELADLPGKYAPPRGRLLLALSGAIAAGCVAIRPLGESICEMKRLYVRPAFRGKGLGRILTLASVEAARKVPYDRMRLDTLASLTPAIALYESLGFRRIPAYYHNPSSCAVFMELDLRRSSLPES